MKKVKHATIGLDKIFLFIILGVTFLIVVAIFIFSLNESKQVQGDFTDKERPSASVSAVFSDLGPMKVKDEKKADFTIENKGTKDLALFKISSSCDCTAGQITIDDQVSPEFGMHSNSGWVGTLKPGQTAQLAVIYRPYIMPVKGVITRDVYVQTNDPQQKSLTFTVKATVD